MSTENDLEAIIQVLKQQLAARLYTQASLVSTGEKEKIGGCLRQWPEVVAAISTEITRTCLFALIRRGPRQFLDWQKLESRRDIEISYFGKQLDQADADLWLACLRLGRGVPIGERIYTTRASLLKAIGRKDDGRTRAWLDAALDRLTGAALRIEISRSGRKLTLRCKLMTSGIENGGILYVRLDPEGAALFDNMSYLDWQQRLSCRSNAAKSLQLYVSGHALGKPHSVLVLDLKKWMGFQGRLRQFRESLAGALLELEAAGLISGTSIRSTPRGDLTGWTRSASLLAPESNCDKNALNRDKSAPTRDNSAVDRDKSAPGTPQSQQRWGLQRTSKQETCF